MEWSRRQLHGGNPYKEGDEFSKRRIDDMQVLLRELPLTGIQKRILILKLHNFPIDDYLEFKRVSAKAKNECCPDENRPLSIYLSEEANVNLKFKRSFKES